MLILNAECVHCGLSLIIEIIMVHLEKAILVQGSPSGFSWAVLDSMVNPRLQEKEGEQLFWRGLVLGN